jgi:hypothetical protein
MQSLSDRLLEAVKANKLEAFRSILKSQAFDLNGLSCLHFAVLYQRLEMIDELIRSGADVNHPGLYDGQFPLYVASSSNSTEVIKKLLQYGANPDLGKAEVSRDTRRPIAAAGQAVKILTTPLLRAIESNYVSTVKQLVDAGADVNQSDQDGYAPLVLATEKGQDEIVTYLLLHGADIEVLSPTGRSLFEVTTREDLRKILRGHLTRNAGARVESRGGRKKPSLWRRLFGGHSSPAATAIVEENVGGVKGSGEASDVKIVAPAEVLVPGGGAGPVLKPSSTSESVDSGEGADAGLGVDCGAVAGKQYGRYVMPVAPRPAAGTFSSPPRGQTATLSSSTAEGALRASQVSGEKGIATVKETGIYSACHTKTATTREPAVVVAAAGARTPTAVASNNSALPVADAALAGAAPDTCTILSAASDTGESAGTRQILMALARKVEALERDQPLLRQLQSTVREQALVLEQQRRDIAALRKQLDDQRAPP